MVALVILIGVLLSAVGYFWLLTTTVRATDAPTPMVLMLLLGTLFGVSQVILWVFSYKRWDVCKRPFLTQMAGLAIAAFGFWMLPAA
ncbi:hypothetical protein Mal64_39010 [Pseudobythopirellula maris]|uniref:Uncharacterized protein n=1 Tax=Pseudobythopirellula maris TaxID=2527991 RepID=A0A5C5ZH15_9BACT|nr:hypothetical protein [Pseudobythopirellula maris]TWT86161.1 hypothetical protein Mal64_39010 [Pseudobythopirellula maris]